jgi:hypothetical protein
MKRMTGMMPVDAMSEMPMPGWGWMTAGVVRFGYNRQGGDRGDDAWESTNWVMGMAHHDLGPGRVTFMMMNSFEAATLGDPGSRGCSDRRNVRWETDRRFSPPARFVHEPLGHLPREALSARGTLGAVCAGGRAHAGTDGVHAPCPAGDNPSAPLGHHWRDSTHISDDVITAGAAAGAGWHSKVRGFTVVNRARIAGISTAAPSIRGRVACASICRSGGRGECR